MKQSQTLFRNIFLFALPSIFFLTFLSPTDSHAQTYISFGDDWNYLDDGSDQGTAWRDAGFNDTGWDSGPAELGYGDGDEATVVSYGGNSNDKHITTYFRHTFTATGFSPSDFLELRVKRDDGVVVYLNGTEVLRDNMPGGTINYNTTASSAVGGGGESTPVLQTIAASLLVDGSNTIAIEIHQANSTSSDITMDFEMENIGYTSASLLRGPYLQIPTPTSVIVKWRTNVPSTSAVRFGEVLGTPSDSAIDMTATTEHEVLVDGLTPDTKYYYSFGDAAGNIGGGSAGFFFRTAPLAGNTDFMRAWILGDAGTANNDQRNVRDAYYDYAGAEETDMILMLGDNAYNSGTDAQYQDAMFENMYEVILRKSPVWSCPGNHDIYSASSSSQTGPYYDIFTFPKAAEAGGLASGTEAYYSWDYGQVHFISLDSDDSPRNVGGSMLTWLTNDLAATTQPWIVVIFHHPPYTKGSHDSDNTGDSGGRMRDMRENVLPILETYGVDLVLSGHSHSYERSYFMEGHYDVSSTFDNNMIVQTGGGQLDVDCSYKKTSAEGDGSVYITAGSSGKITGTLTAHPAMFAYLYQRGSVILEVEQNRMDVKFLNESDVVSDYFTIDKDVYNGSTDTTIIDGDSIDLTASWANGFSWNNGGGTAQTITVSPSEDIQYIVSDPNGCLADTFNITVLPGCVEQDIPIAQGWSMISSFVIPDTADMLDVIGDISDDIIIVKNSSGQVAVPSGPLNLIGDWQVDEGYQVKASAANTLTVGCTDVLPDATPISLNAGWSIVSYLRTDAMDIATGLASITSELIIAKDGAGNVYLPGLLNNIGNQVPGQGYQLKMSAPATLTYPANTSRVSAPSTYTAPETAPRFGALKNTGNNATVIFPAEALADLSDGDAIGIYNTRGDLCGSSVYRGAPLAIPVWGVEAGSTDDRAMAEDEPFTAMIWKAGSLAPTAVDLQLQGSHTTYTRNGIYVVEALEARQAGALDALTAEVYPNPSDGRIQIAWSETWSEGTPLELTVNDVYGRELIRKTVDGTSHDLDLENFPPGTYFIGLSSGERQIEQPVILLR